MVRIPINIKIPVNDAGKPSGLAAARTAIADLSSGFEKITVRIFKQQNDNKTQKIKPSVGREIRRSQPRQPVLYQPKFHYQQARQASPRIRYSVKTFHITLTWPTLPSLLEFLRKTSKKTWLISAAVISALVILIICLEIFTSGQTAAPPRINTEPRTSSTASVKPQLTRGTPKYATILPVGKTIQQLGGWVRVSPPGTSPVYTYVDKIGSARLDVSEQQLPEAFRSNTSSKISQLATSYNATDKITASNNTIVYVGSSGNSAQFAILTKARLLIFIKSTESLTNNQWVDYVSSLQ